MQRRHLRGGISSFVAPGKSRLQSHALRAWLFGFALTIGCGDSAHSGEAPQLPTTAAQAGHAAVPAATAEPSPTIPNAAPAASTPATSQPAPPSAAPSGASGAGSASAGSAAEKPPEQTPSKPASQPPADPPSDPATEDPSKDGALIRGADPTEGSAAKAGPYTVERITSGFRNGPDFGGATIYYPSDAEPPFAMIVFCPGWLGTQASDAKWAPFLTSHGFVFMNIDTNAIGDSVLQRQAAEMDALESLKAEHTRQDSPLKAKLALDRVSLMGWSMGGGGAWLNGTKHPEIKAIVTLAGHNATAGGASPIRTLSVPTLMLAGTADTPVLGLGMSQPVYDVIPEKTPKLLYEVSGASHFDFNDPAFADGIPARYVLSWQKVYLEGDMRYYKFLLAKGPNAADFRTNLE